MTPSFVLFGEKTTKSELDWRSQVYKKEKKNGRQKKKKKEDLPKDFAGHWQACHAWPLPEVS